jgi:hypothetical protein
MKQDYAESAHEAVLYTLKPVQERGAEQVSAEMIRRPNLREIIVVPIIRLNGESYLT